MPDVTKTCANCGRIQETGNFCEACGTRLTTVTAPPPSVEPSGAARVGAATTVEPVLAPPSVMPAGDVSAAAPSPPYEAPQYGAPRQGAPQYGAPQYAPTPRVPHDDVWNGLADFTFRRFPTPGLVRLAWVVALIWAVLSLIVSLWLISDGWGGGISVFMVLKAIAVAVFTVLVVRVALEAALALHRIRESKDQTQSDTRP